MTLLREGNKKALNRCRGCPNPASELYQGRDAMLIVEGHHFLA